MGCISKYRWRAVSAFVAAAVIMAIVGCATDTGQEQATLPVEIGGGVGLTLPRPVDLGKTFSAAQSVVIRYGDRVFPVEVRFSGTPARVLIVGLDPLGRRTMTLNWTEDGIEAETAPWFPPGVPMRNLLADIVMIYWPEKIVRTALSGTGVRLESGPAYRTVLAGGETVVRIDYETAQPTHWSGTVRYRNLARNYSIDIRSVEVPQ